MSPSYGFARSFNGWRGVLRLQTTRVHARMGRPRCYASVAAPDKLTFSLTLPHQTLVKAENVLNLSVQVNLPAETGRMGVLANHVPCIEQLKPGLVEILGEQGTTKQLFISGGFAVVQPDSQLTVNAVEAYPLDSFSATNISSSIAELQKIASNSSASDIEQAEARLEIEVLESLQDAMK